MSSLKSIVRAMGGELYHNGKRANIPAPGHSAKDRSVSLALNGDRVVVHTFNDTPWTEVLDDLRSRQLIDQNNYLTGSAGAPRSFDPVLTDTDRIAQARTIWNLGRAIAGTLAEIHCRRRGILGALPGPETLRFVYQTPVSVYQANSRTFPALVAAIRGENGDLVAIEITYLAPNGARADHLRVPRKTVGSPECPCAVRLDPLGPDLCVGEGLFTQLSARDHFGWPSWALLSTSNLRNWRPPPGVRRLLITGDRGKDGERSARKLYARAIDLGLRASLRLPPLPFNDFNQVMNAALPQ